jgi:xylose isomerase
MDRNARRRDATLGKRIRRNVGLMSSGFFGDIAPIEFEGSDSTNPLAFRHYDADALVSGKRLEDQLRFAVCYWHTFVWTGGDAFGGQTFDRPWFADTMEAAKRKADTAFELFTLLGVPFYCFHDADVRPEGGSFAADTRNLEEMGDYLGRKQADTGVRLLWGTANLFSNRRYMAGAATNPDPDVFAYAAATVKTCIDTTHRLQGANYVLWGGREGYETLLNTDLGRELDQLGRFLNLVVEYKHKIGFKGTILVEPKPQEPTKHQYDFDVAAVYGFLERYGLENEVKVNIESGHAVLAGHSFEHELALANALGIFGSIDMNRNDYQSGWDTDQFPNNVPETALAYYHILRNGGFTTGGTNFDAKLRRQSIDPVDLLTGHIGAMDCCARALKAAAKMLGDQTLEDALRKRYAAWESPAAQKMLAGEVPLEAIEARVRDTSLNPEPVSGRQEFLENIVNRYV